ncbi:MAG: RNA methyltransferase [Cyclobacteriaceae bacterium]|nr:RNA methyltransferase [Cyclobacteriaceae bacterium]MDW8332187.1 RNA methyltransferase [Cyclobacteriaceae bacterium]
MSTEVYNTRLTQYLANYLTENRKTTIEQVLSHRTRKVTIALEDIYQPQNASAVVRTCECFGVQDIHIIENTTSYQLNKKVLKGSYKWVNLIRYKQKNSDNTLACIQALRNRGYRIVATDPAGRESLEEFDFGHEKVALVFGNEDKGVSSTVLENCDTILRIPMKGFTESLNVSVSVAVCLYQIMLKLWKSGDYGLSEDEKNELRLSWYRKSIRGSAMIEKRFLESLH